MHLLSIRFLLSAHVQSFHTQVNVCYVQYLVQRWDKISPVGPVGREDAGEAVE